MATRDSPHVVQVLVVTYGLAKAGKRVRLPRTAQSPSPADRTEVYETSDKGSIPLGTTGNQRNCMPDEAIPRAHRGSTQRADMQERA